MARSSPVTVYAARPDAADRSRGDARPVRYTDFIRKVEARAAGGLEPERAEHATRAVLGALGDCLRPDVAGRLAAQLPKQLQPAPRAARAPGRGGWLSAVKL